MFFSKYTQRGHKRLCQHLHFQRPFRLTDRDENSSTVSYSEVCPQDSVNGNTMAFTVMVIVIEIKIFEYQHLLLTFAICSAHA